MPAWLTSRKSVKMSPGYEPPLLIRAASELSRVKDEPRLLVIITHGFIDLIVNTLIEKECKHAKQIVSDHRSYSHAIKLVLLNEMKVISDHHYSLLKWFNNLRNEFAHKPLFVLTEDRLSVFTSPAFQKVDKFGGLCQAILLDLWQIHSEQIGHVFYPEAMTVITTEVLMVEEPAPAYMIGLKSDPARIKREANFDDTMELAKAIVEKEKRAKENRGQG